MFDMGNSDDLTEAEIRRAVREEMSRVGRSVLSTVFWTILAAFTVLVGLQAVQMGFYTTGLAAVALIAVGILVTSASIYLFISFTGSSNVMIRSED
jgi:hypothetical protein